MTAPTVVSFAELGVMCYRDGVLADGLELLAQRLDYAGAGQLVAALLSVDWVEGERAGKGNPQPRPKPPPDPPKPPPDPPKDGRS